MAKHLFPCLLLLASVAPAGAGTGAADGLVEDTKLYFTAPLRWDGRDWLHFGETLALIGISHQYDDDVRAHFDTRAHPALGSSDTHELRDGLPAAGIVAATWAAAFLAQNRDGYEEGREMLESAAFSTVTTTLFKYAAGRRRPNETTDADDWSRSGDSFPSRNTGIAFAVGTVLAESGNERHRWIRRILGYGLAGATAYSRLHDNAHWLSDTVAGAAIGISTAHFVMRRGENRVDNGEFSVVPVDGGLMFAWHATR